MSEQDVLLEMTDKRHGVPIAARRIDNKYFVAIYEGGLSEFDFRVAYKEKHSRIRQPKHIHWTVDLLMKKVKNNKLTCSFIESMQEQWAEIKGVSSISERKQLMDNIDYDKIKMFQKLSFPDTYDIQFIYTVMTLLMFQEKTNNPNAFMFKSILDALLTDRDLYSIISTATFIGNK